MDMNEHANEPRTSTSETEVASVQTDGEASRSTSSNSRTNSETRTWKTTFLRIGPLAGVACMAAAIASIVAALGVLVGSRGAAVPTWTVPPSTYLAICTAIANQALRFAAFQGLAIAWWYRATRGDSLAQLHHSWRAGMTASGAIISGRNMGLIGLACLCSTLVAIDGPLLQKATTIELAPFDMPPVTLNVSITPEIPRDYTGGWWPVERTYKMSPSFNETIPTVSGNTSNFIQFEEATPGNSAAAWFESVAITGAVRGCPSKEVCRTTVRGPALAVTSCISKKLPVDYWIPTEDKVNFNSMSGPAPPFYTLDFLVDISLILGETEKINLVTGYGRSDNCTGHFYYDICTLESAIGEYNITVREGHKATLEESPPRIIALANNTIVNRDWSAHWQWYPSTLAGIVALGYERYESATVQFTDHGTMQMTGYGSPTFRQYTDINPADAQLCWEYKNPQADIFHDLNRLMFLVGAVAANDSHVVRNGRLDPGLQEHTTTLGYLEGNHNVFATNLRWFGGALVVELWCIALILPTYFGFWKLGRSVSFSPLEVAKAFEAPLLSDCNSNSSGGEIAKTVGHTRVQYGQVSPTVKDSSEAFGQSKLAFADPSMVDRPQKNATFGT